MTTAARMAFEEFLCNRVRESRALWEAARQSQRVHLDRAAAAPEPDGSLLRRQARAFPELKAYLEALKDLADLMLRKEFRPELVQEWRSVNRKPMTTAHPETPSASSQDQSTKRRA